MTRRRRAAYDLLLFLGTQFLVQAMAIVVGFAIIWTLPVADYAIYTIVNSLASVLIVGADLGLASAIITIANRKRLDPRIVAEALALPRAVLMVGINVIIAGLAVVYFGPDIDPVTYAACFAIVLLQASVVVRTQMLVGILDANGNVRARVVGATAGSMTRTVGIGVTCLLGGGAVPIVAVTLLSAFVEQQSVRRYARGDLSGADMVRPSERRARAIRVLAMRLLLPTVPNKLYYIFRPQIEIAILAVATSLRELAAYGALSRFGIIIAVLSSLLPIWVQARISLAQTKRAAASIAINRIVLFAAVVTLLFAGSYVFSRQLAVLIGPKYFDYHGMIPWVVLSAGFSLMSATLSSMLTGIAATRHSYGITLVAIVSQLACVLLLDIASVEGIVRMSLIVNAVTCLATSALLLMSLTTGWTRMSSVAPRRISPKHVAVP